MTAARETLPVACRELVPGLADERIAALLEYGRLIRERNMRINLVSRRDVDRLETYHTLDSLAVERLLPQASSVCDIGTGAGFPGIPVAIARPDIRMTLVESSRKKCRFLEDAVRTLQLEAVIVINDRAEFVPSLDCDVVLSRLTAPVERLVPEAHHHRSVDGRIVLYKTPGSAGRVDNIRSLLDKHGLAITDIVDVVLPISKITRRFVVLGSPPTNWKKREKKATQTFFL